MKGSDCCGALVYGNGDEFCSECGEHCETFEDNPDAQADAESEAAAS